MRDSRFDGSLGCLSSRHVAGLATRLASVIGLSSDERDHVLNAARAAISDNLHRKLSRLLVLELNAARVEGRLEGETPEARWANFLEASSRQAFWDALSRHYPSLLERVDAVCGNVCDSTFAFASRWAADRGRLETLCGEPPGDLRAVAFGAGDTHRGGSTVAILTCEKARLVYKPRSLAPEDKLCAFIAGLERDLGRDLSIRVPKVVDAGDHGWAQFVAHKHADGPGELHRYYEGIGQWLAVMRVVGGSDFHAENLIAHGAFPVIVDCETLFTPAVNPFSRAMGDATDKAIKLISGGVLATGLLPRRGSSLGWRGVDMSGIGALTGQQPMLMLPDIIDAGSDVAKFGLSPVQLLPQQNHPAADPSLVTYWPDVFKGFTELSAAFRRLDAAGDLEGRLAPFKDCRVRVIVRPTSVYAEIGQMLWHPVSLHKEDEARARARDLFKKMSDNLAMAPSDPDVIDAEIDDMMVGDVPYFSTIAQRGVLDGPGGTHWLAPRDLVTEALQKWREADLDLEGNYVRTTLISAYANDGWMAFGEPIRVSTAQTGDLDRRRRAQAAIALRKLSATAIHGRDGSVNWIAPTLTANGFSVEVLGGDAYGGLSGIAIATAAYVREQRAGRADFVAEAEPLLAGILKTLHAAEDKHKGYLRDGVKLRPSFLGLYLGLGAQIWRHLALSQWGLGNDDSLVRAAALAREMPAASAHDEMYDILTGRAGAIPVLLALTRATGNTEFLEIARTMGDELCERAKRDGDRAYWTHERWPEGLGGFAHGATGIGWSLFKLADATGDARHYDTAKAAFAFEDSLYDTTEQNWVDLRNLGGPKTGCAWCHGAVGIGLARLDLDPQLTRESTRTSLRDAAAVGWQFGLGWSHCICHGSVGMWELLDRAIAAGEGPKDLTREQALGALVSSVEESGPSYGMLREAYVPGLMLGMAGVAYQLLKADPASRLPSVQTFDGFAAAPHSAHPAAHLPA